MWLMGKRALVTGSSRSLLLIVAAALMMNACLPREVGPPGSTARPPDVTSLASAQHTTDPGQWPLSFVENRGQLDPHVGYSVPGRNATTYFTAAGLTYAIQA